MEKITDVFGNLVIKANVPILLIQTHSGTKLLNKIAFENNNSIWEINEKEILTLLEKNEINGNLYKTMGHYWFPHIRCDIGIKIVLANINYKFISFPVDFINIGSYSAGYIWKPICKNNFINLGLIYSKNKPKNESLCTIIKDYTINYNGETDVMGNMTNYNEFYLLGMTEVLRITLFRSHFIKNDKKLKIKNVHINKYLNSNTDNIIFENTPVDLIYTINGQIKINDKCMERIDNNPNDNISIELRNCNENISQKWFPFASNNNKSYYNLVSQNDLLNMAVVGDGTDVIKQNVIATKSNITNPKKQIFKFENIENIKNNENNNNDEKKMNIDNDVHLNYILVESDNPWYINKSSIPQKYVQQKYSSAELNSKSISEPNQNYAKYYNDNHKIEDKIFRHSYNNFTVCANCNKNNYENFTNFHEEINNKTNKIKNACIIFAFLVITYTIFKNFKKS